MANRSSSRSPSGRYNLSGSFIVRRWARAHRRVIAIVLCVVVVVLAAFEIGVRAITPDTMQIVEYGNPQLYRESANTIIYQQVVTNPRQIAATYQALTQRAADWATQVDQGAGSTRLHTCPQYGLSADLRTRSHLLVVRFLWHGFPVAVATHYPIEDNPYPLWTCQLNMTEWQVSAGGIVNPRPYVSDGMLTLFPNSIP